MADLEALYPRLLRYARRKADPAAAEDIVQNALIRAGWADDAPDGRYFAAVAHAAIDWWRHESRRATTALPVSLPAPQPDPDVAAALADTLARLAQVPHGALLLAYARGVGWPELVAERGLPLGTIKTRAFRARKALGPCPLDT